MARERVKEVRSFALRIDTLATLKRVAAEAGITGGMSVIAENAIASWLRKYEADPAGWLKSRGLSAVTAPQDDEI